MKNLVLVGGAGGIGRSLANTPHRVRMWSRYLTITLTT